MRIQFLPIALALTLVATGCRDKGAFDWKGTLIIDCAKGPLTLTKIEVEAPGLTMYETTTDANGSFSISGSWNEPSSFGYSYENPKLKAKWYDFTLGHNQQVEIPLEPSVKDYGDLVLLDSLHLILDLDTTSLSCQGCQLSVSLNQENVGEYWANNEYTVLGNVATIPFIMSIAYKKNQAEPLFPVLLKYALYDPVAQKSYSYNTIDITTHINRCLVNVDSITLKL